MGNKKIELRIEPMSVKKTLDRINELNTALEKAKTLIDELAKNKVLLELNIGDLTQSDVQGNFRP